MSGPFETPLSTCMYKLLKKRLSEKIEGNVELIHHLCVIFDMYIRKLDAITQGVGLDALPNFNLFVSGATGTGKTDSIMTAAHEVGLPILRINCTTLSPEGGWAGVSVRDLLTEKGNALLKGSDKHLPGVGVILLDEFDKLGNNLTCQGGGSYTGAVQYSLLDLLEGNLVDPLNKALVIAAGSFEGYRRAQQKEKGMGFVQETKKRTKEDWLQAMVDQGIIPELANRFTDFVESEKLTKKQVIRVLKTQKNSQKSKYNQLLQGFTLTSLELEEIADAVVASDQGFRVAHTYLYRLVSARYKSFYKYIEETQEEDGTLPIIDESFDI